MVFEKNLQRDIEIAFSLLNEKYSEDTYKIYPWSNERIFKYYNCYDLTNKKALCVTASGDHALYAIHAGAKKIDCIDINPLCKYYQALKIALILTYEEEEFFSYFKNNGKKLLIDSTILNEIKNSLKDEVFVFWNELISSRSFKKNKKLFRTDGWPAEIIINYETLKNQLKNVDINYYDSDINTFSNGQKYDVIFLSNLLEWQKNRQNTFSKCMDLLNDNGILYDVFINRCFDNTKPFPYFEKKIQTEFNTNDLNYSDKGVYTYKKK